MNFYFQVLFGLVVTAIMVNLSSCVSPHQNPNLPNLISSSDYFSTVEDYTETKKEYDGFYQTLELSGTLLNTKVSRAQVDQKARLYQWSPEQYANSKSEVEGSLSRETKVFVSLFVPERKHDDLGKPKSLWKIFLDVGGRRYEGKAEKMKAVLADVQSLYPHHTRFSTPYMVTFPVPASMVENAESKFTMTGPVSSTALEFKVAE